MLATKRNDLSREESRPRKSSAGYAFDEFDDEWVLDGSIRIGLSFLSEMEVDRETAAGFRQSLSRYAQELSSAHCFNIRNRVVHFFKTIKSKEFSVEALSKYRSMLSDEHIWYVGVIRGFLESWKEWGYLGIDGRAIKYLSDLTLKGNEKGVAVLVNCPFSGPYTFLEHQSLLYGLADAYVENRISQQEYSFLLAVSMTGRRPVQIRYLKLCDLSFEDSDGRCAHYLSVPRAKQRGSATFRAEMKRVIVCKDLWDSLCDQRNQVLSWVESNVGVVSESVQSKLPLFPNYERLGRCRPSELMSSLNTDFLHQTQSDVSLIRLSLNSKVVAYSERTGERLIIGFNRLRRTYATNLAREGFGPMVIAEALDHSDTQQVGVYARPERETAKQVSAVMAPLFSPLAMAFAGTLVASERDALRGNDPHSRVKLSTDVEIGNCGNSAFCSDGWKSCYVCRNFQPWLHGPHRSAHELLMRERETQQNAGVSVRVIEASDRTLLAILQVIQMCDAHNSEGFVSDGVVVNG